MLLLTLDRPRCEWRHVAAHRESECGGIAIEAPTQCLAQERVVGQKPVLLRAGDRTQARAAAEQQIHTGTSAHERATRARIDLVAGPLPGVRVFARGERHETRERDLQTQAVGGAERALRVVLAEIEVVHLRLADQPPLTELDPVIGERPEHRSSVALRIVGFIEDVAVHAEIGDVQHWREADGTEAEACGFLRRRNILPARGRGEGHQETGRRGSHEFLQELHQIRTGVLER